jgi:hypothetical protein
MAHRWTFFAILSFALMLASLPLAAADSLPTTWDHLVKVDSKNFGSVFVLPGADFRPYTKVMLDPTEVAFDKNWQRDYNNRRLGSSAQVSDEDVRQAADMARAAFSDILARAYANAGYQIVTAPGRDVLRVSTAVINLEVTAPDPTNTAKQYSGSAGQAMVVFEARDSMTGAILGRAIDARVAGDSSPLFLRDRATNTQDFAVLFQNWADASISGLSTLKAMSPVSAAAVTASP